MIFDPTTCCACAAVQELQGEAPLTLSGEGLWAGVLSSGQCVLECPGSQSAAGSSGDLLLGFGTFTLRPVTPCHLLCVRLTGLAVQQFLAGLPQPRFADGASCPGAAELLARVCRQRRRPLHPAVRPCPRGRGIPPSFAVGSPRGGSHPR